MYNDNTTLSVQSGHAQDKTPMLKKMHMQTTAILFWHQGEKKL